MLLKKLFSSITKAKTKVELNGDFLSTAISTNRNSLNQIDDWIDDAAFKSSFFSYGVPDYIKIHLNKKISNALTYTDYLLAIGNKHFEQVNYFEIGVSVGKNFYQVVNGFNKGTFTGFDIEEINPVLEKQFTYRGKNKWPTPTTSIKKNESSMLEYEFKGKKINYVSADIWDENSWKKLNNNRYNIIFSDALHTPEAILFEFEMIVKYNLLAERFIIIWDDLVGDMKQSFYSIIKKYNRMYKIKDVYLMEVNGWIGEFETPHSVGIISNFSI